MKSAFLCFLFLIFAFVRAENSTPAANSLPKTTYASEFSKKDSSTRVEWQQLVAQAAQKSQEQQVLEALTYVAAAEQIFANHPHLLAIKSFCYIQQQRLDLALETAKQSYALNNQQQPNIHNLAEVYFDLNQWDEAKKYYTKLLAFGSNPILQFKLDIIEIKLGNIESIKPKLADIDPLNPEPYYFFLNYVLHCEEHPHNSEIKNSLITQIKTIYQYNPNLLLPWFDKINHSGYGL